MFSLVTLFNLMLFMKTVFFGFFMFLTLIKLRFLRVAFSKKGVWSIWTPLHISTRTNVISILLNIIVKKPI